MIRRFGGLPEHLAAFCGLLRREYGFRIGTGELLDAARALEVVDISDEQRVRAALRATLAGSYEDVVAFDAAFDRFFLESPPTRHQDLASAMPSEHDAAPADEVGPASPRARIGDALPADADESPAEGIGPTAPIDVDASDIDAAHLARASYSPIGVKSSDAEEIEEVDDAWVTAARALVRRLQLGPSRKWRLARAGRRFDLRRTLRASLQTGGEPLTPRWLARPRRQPRFVVLVDASRSMSPYAGTALKIALALTRATPRVEVFAFSTALQRVTADVRRAALGRPQRIRPLAYAWGGGTTIGACLTDFLRRFGDRLLVARPVVIVASDGLDVGDPELLRRAMQALRRRSGALVWLNPLLETPGYEPTARGMSIARPFVTTFSSVTDLGDFVRLSRTLRLRS